MRGHRSRRGCTRLALLTLVFLGACPSQRGPEKGRSGSTRARSSEVRPAVSAGRRPDVLVLGLTPFLDRTDMLREFSPLAAYLGERLGIPVKLKLAKSYADLSHLVARRRVHMAIFSPFAYVRARQENPDLVLLATQISNGSPTYAGYIIARDDGPVRTVNDLRGRRFAFVDRRSASGYLYAMAYLRARGIDPERYFSSIVFAGNHNALTDLVLSGTVDAGATNATAFKMARLEKKQGHHLRIIAKTGRIPLDAYCAVPELDAALIANARRALLDLSTRTETGRRVLRGLTAINGFVEVSDEHYEEVRRVAALVHGDVEAAAPAAR